MKQYEVDDVVYTESGGGTDSLWLRIREALSEFLGVPLLIVLSFIVLAVLVFWLDQSDSGWVLSWREAISQYLFRTSAASGAMMSLIGGGLLTMTSLVISMLLLALQQTAGNMGNLVYDQFMKRRRNQVYAGYIVGTVVLTFLLRPTPGDNFNPVLAATATTIAAIIGIILLLYFLFSTITQMRPQTIVHSVRSDTLRARRRQADFLQRTRRTPRLNAAYTVALRIKGNGFLTNIDADKMAEVLTETPVPVEVESRATLGAYLAYHELLAWVKSDDLGVARHVANHIGEAFVIAGQRDDKHDPKFGLEQLEMMGWTEMSTAKENPETGLMAIHIIRDLLSRWTVEQPAETNEDEDVTRIPLVYPDDVVLTALSTLESLAMVVSESKQHQGLAAVLHTLARLLPRLPRKPKERAEELLVRVLPTLDKHGLTRELDYALASLVEALEEIGNAEVAQLVRDARQQQAEKLPQYLPPPAPSPLVYGRPALPDEA